MYSRTNLPKKISAAELEAVLERVRDERWKSLFLCNAAFDYTDKYLRTLPLGRTYRIDALPSEAVWTISRLSKLCSLSLVLLEIKSDEARALASLSNLTSLHLSDSRIGDEGARALSSLSQLTWLSLSGNRIGDEGARTLASLSNLTSLNLRKNRLTRMPVEFTPLRNLQYLDLRENEGLNVPPEIVKKTHDAQAILRYIEQIAGATQEEKRSLNEAKMLLVGEGSVGKTSLRNMLIDGRCEESERTTEGIDIRAGRSKSAMKPFTSRSGTSAARRSITPPTSSSSPNAASTC